MKEISEFKKKLINEKNLLGNEKRNFYVENLQLSEKSNCLCY